MKQCYRLANRNIEVCSLYPDIHSLCLDYRADGPADFLVETGMADIARERELSARVDALTGKAHRYSDGYLETLAVYRKIAERMPDYDTVLCHGSCVAVDGAGYLFAAPSGTGKSTHARLWRELLGDRAVMVNDDKPLIQITDVGATAFGTPWNGKHRLSCNIAVPLKAVCVLERAERNAICPITASEAYSVLLRQIYLPADSAAMRKTIMMIDRLIGVVRLWRLGCNMEPEAAKIAYEAMKE